MKYLKGRGLDRKIHGGMRRYRIIKAKRKWYERIPTASDNVAFEECKSVNKEAKKFVSLWTLKNSSFKNVLHRKFNNVKNFSIHFYLIDIVYIVSR